MKKYIFILLSLLLPVLSSAQTPVSLTDNLEEICLCREKVTYLEDPTSKLSIHQIIKKQTDKDFKKSIDADLVNRNTSSAYWLNFRLKNESDKPFRIELYDYDLDEISLFLPNEKGLYQEQKAGYSEPFHNREIHHKNISFQVAIPKGNTASIYMRFKSKRQNVLEPILKSYDKFLNYGVAEYMLLGLFYGLIFFVIFYNFLYFILLKKVDFLYYVVFSGGILLYILAENGTGFQFLWPNHPSFNPYSAEIGLYIGMIALFFFSYRLLYLARKGPLVKMIFVSIICIRTLLFVFQLIYPDAYKWELWDIVFIQFALLAAIWTNHYEPAKWFIAAFTLLNISFLISGLEQAGFIPSSAFTVYAFNIGIICNFIFLSIANGEAIQETYRLKDEANARLILEFKKNEELHERINRELEQLVRLRTKVLEEQNIEIQKQKEEIREMYKNLEVLIQQRTTQLEERNTTIKEYSFSNSHLVRASLARILGLTDLAKRENEKSEEILGMIETNAKELDAVIRGMNRILDA